MSCRALYGQSPSSFTVHRKDGQGGVFPFHIVVFHQEAMNDETILYSTHHSWRAHHFMLRGGGGEANSSLSLRYNSFFGVYYHCNADVTFARSVFGSAAVTCLLFIAFPPKPLGPPVLLIQFSAGGFCRYAPMLSQNKDI